MRRDSLRLENVIPFCWLWRNVDNKSTSSRRLHNYARKNRS